MSLPEGRGDALHAACMAVVAEFIGGERETGKAREDGRDLPSDWEQPPDVVARNLADVEEWLDLTELEDSGDRSKALLDTACALCKWFDDVSAFNVMVAHPAIWAVALDKRSGSEKRARDFLWRESIRAARRAVGQPFDVLALFDDLTVGEAPVEQRAGTALELPDLELSALSASRFIDTPPPPQVFHGPIPASTTGVVYGPGGASKSTIMQALCNVLGTGVDVLGVPWWAPAAPVRVLMLSAEESTADLHRRQHAIVEAVATADMLDDGFFDAPEPRAPVLRDRLHEGRFVLVSTQGMRIELANERGRCKGADWLLRQADRGQFDVIVVDPVASFRTGPEDAFQPLIDVGRAINAKTGAAVVFVHHSNKASRGTDQAREATAARGDSALLDGARFGLGVAGMALEEATKLKVDPDERRHFVGVRLAKANYRAESEVVWFRRGHAGVPYATSFKSEAQHRTDARKGQRDAVLRLVAELEAKEQKVSKSSLVDRAMDRKIGTRDGMRILIENLIAEKALRFEYGEPGDVDRRSFPHGWIVTGGQS